MYDYAQVVHKFKTVITNKKSQTKFLLYGPAHCRLIISSFERPSISQKLNCVYSLRGYFQTVTKACNQHFLQGARRDIRCMVVFIKFFGKLEALDADWVDDGCFLYLRYAVNDRKTDVK